MRLVDPEPSPSTSIQVGSSILRLHQGDITKQDTEVIVNAAISRLAHGGGVARSIADAAGSELVEESNDASYVATGSVHTTAAGKLEARYVIHAVGPVYQGGRGEEEKLLRSSVRNSLAELERLGCSSISFPAISTGIYGYPIGEAAAIMLDEAYGYLERTEGELDVVFVLFSSSDFDVFSSALSDLES